MFECNIEHPRSVAVLCMLYKIKCNAMHSLSGALHVPYVPVRVTRGALVAHRYSYISLLAAESRSTAGILLPSQCPCGTILLTLYSMMWDWRVSRLAANAFLLAYAALSLFVFYCFSLSLLRMYKLVLWGWGHYTDRVKNHSLPATADLF